MKPGQAANVLAGIRRVTGLDLRDLYQIPDLMPFIQTAGGHEGVSIQIREWTFISEPGSGKLSYHNGHTPSKRLLDD